MVSNSYYDTQTSHRTGGFGAKTTAELQSPTSATGIYANWNRSLWDFGTASDYPLLSVDFNGDGTSSWQEFGKQTRIIRAKITSIAITSKPGQDATYAIGDTVNVTATFDEDMTVTGTPQLALDFDGAARSAAYTGTEGAIVSFAYTVAEGDTAGNGVAVPANALTLNGGAILNDAGDGANLAHDAVAAASGHRVDGVRPTLVSGKVGRSGRLVIIKFSERIMVAPLLAELSELSGLSVSEYLMAVMDFHVAGKDVGMVRGLIGQNQVSLFTEDWVLQGQSVTLSYDNIFASEIPGLIMDQAGNHLNTFAERALTNESEATSGGSPEGLSVDQSHMTVEEGGTATYQVSLESQPSGNVTVTIEPHQSNEKLTISPSTLVFTADNWNTAQTVTLSGEEDDDSLSYWAVLEHTASGSNYEAEAHVRVLVTDNDKQPAVVSPE